MNQRIAFGAAATLAGAAALAAAASRRERTRIVAGLQPPGAVRMIGGERIHYVDQGAGAAVVLIHGFAGSTFSWRSTIAALAADHRVVALDLPGFGFSDRQPREPLTLEQHAQRVRRLMDELGIEKATVIGHSMGGAVASRLAIACPERVERLVLVASMDASEGNEWRRDGDRARLPLYFVDLGLAIPSLMRLASRMILRRITFDPAYASPEVVRQYCDPLLIPGTGACLRQLFAGTHDEEPADLGRVAVPVLVISGAADRSIPQATGDSIAAAIPGARHVVVEEAGHLVAEERPEEFMALVRPFLGELQAAKPRRGRKPPTAATANG